MLQLVTDIFQYCSEDNEGNKYHTHFLQKQLDLSFLGFVEHQSNYNGRNTKIRIRLLYNNGAKG